MEERWHFRSVRACRKARQKYVFAISKILKVQFSFSLKPHRLTSLPVFIQHFLLTGNYRTFLDFFEAGNKLASRFVDLTVTRNFLGLRCKSNDQHLFCAEPHQFTETCKDQLLLKTASTFVEGSLSFLIALHQSLAYPFPLKVLACQVS